MLCWWGGWWTIWLNKHPLGPSQPLQKFWTLNTQLRTDCKTWKPWLFFDEVVKTCKTWIPFLLSSLLFSFYIPWLFFDEIVKTDESSSSAPSPPLFAPPGFKIQIQNANQMIKNNIHRIIFCTKKQNHKIMCSSFVLTLSNSKFSRSPWSPDSGASASSGTNSLLDSRALLKRDT